MIVRARSTRRMASGSRSHSNARASICTARFVISMASSPRLCTSTTGSLTASRSVPGAIGRARRPFLTDLKAIGARCLLSSPTRVARPGVTYACAWLRSRRRCEKAALRQERKPWSSQKRGRSSSTALPKEEVEVEGKGSPQQFYHVAGAECSESDESHWASDHDFDVSHT